MAPKKGKKSLQKARPSSSRLVSIPEIPNYDKKSPVFSLERLQGGDYCLSALEQVDKAAFSDAIFKRRKLSWSEIISTGRHKLGFEKIPKQSIKAPIPEFITEEVDNFLAFRFSGMKPMVGYRKNEIFYVLWFDHNFTLYDHA